MTPLLFTDQELSMLSDIVRQNKITLTQEDLVMLIVGKKSSPITDLTLKVVQAWEARQVALKQPVTAEELLDKE